VRYINLVLWQHVVCCVWVVRCLDWARLWMCLLCCIAWVYMAQQAHRQSVSTKRCTTHTQHTTHDTLPQHNKHTNSRSQLNTVRLTHNTRHTATAQQAHRQPVSTEHRTTHTQHTTHCHSTTSTPTACLNWTPYDSHTAHDTLPQHNKHTDSQSQLNTVRLTHNTRHDTTAAN